MSQDPIVQLLIAFLTTPSSDFYLSKQILASNSPKLEPFDAGTVPLGKQTVSGIAIDMTLKNLVVAGLASIQIAKPGGKPDITVNGSSVSFVAQHPNTEAPPAGVPKDLTIACDFHGVAVGVNLDGQLKVTIKNLNLDGTFDATAPNGDVKQAVISFTKLKIDASTSPGNINVDLKINSSFGPFINEILNSSSVLSKILAGVNSQISSAQILRSLSSAATDAARSALAKGPL